MEKRGKFITFEGGEGAGKSTQVRFLKAALDARGVDCVLTREPGGSQAAENIRRLLVEGEPGRWDPLAETLLFLAARADHVAKIIEPALAAGRWVICDRFADSTIAYQGAGRGLGIERVRRLQKAVFGDFSPDLTLILDLDPETGLRRTISRAPSTEDRFERFDRSFHENLRRAFRDIAANEPKRCILVNAARAAELVAADIWPAVELRFLGK